MSETREVLRCRECGLVQFRTASGLCRKCHLPYVRVIEIPKVVSAELAPAMPANTAIGAVVAHAVKSLREAQGLTQRQLAARMEVLRTYVSKVENGKATPTLASLNRFAIALEVTLADLVSDQPAACLLTRGFMAEMGDSLRGLDVVQQARVLRLAQFLSERKAAA